MNISNLLINNNPSSVSCYEQRLDSIGPCVKSCILQLNQHSKNFLSQSTPFTVTVSTPTSSTVVATPSSSSTTSSSSTAAATAAAVAPLLRLAAIGNSSPSSPLSSPLSSYPSSALDAGFLSFVTTVSIAQEQQQKQQGSLLPRKYPLTPSSSSSSLDSRTQSPVLSTQKSIKFFNVSKTEIMSQERPATSSTNSTTTTTTAPTKTEIENQKQSSSKSSSQQNPPRQKRKYVMKKKNHWHFTFTGNSKEQNNLQTFSVVEPVDNNTFTATSPLTCSIPSSCSSNLNTPTAASTSTFFDNDSKRRRVF